MDNNLSNKNINWFPGHMTKTRRMMEENIKLVDVVVEVIDARAPGSSKNPYLDQLWSKRPRVIALNKTDLADPAVTERWKRWYKKQGWAVVLIDAAHGKNVRQIAIECEKIVKQKQAMKTTRAIGNKSIKMMITGIPNVGKSTVVNQLAKRSGAAKTGNRPGVTKAKQWIRVSDQVMLLDTPGILWPKFENNEVGLRLAFIGSISDDVMDMYTLAVDLLDRLKENYANRLVERYGIDPSICEMGGDRILVEIGRKRGHLKSGGEVDTDRTAVMLIDEFRAGKLSRISLELPPKNEEEEEGQEKDHAPSQN